jgi:DNA-binding PucR family transcriptional regulator
MSGFRVARAWPEAPAPVAADDLLLERTLGGDQDARRHLVEQVYLPLVESRGALLETIEAWFGHGRSVEATARALFVHPNTIRYRLRQVDELTHLSPTQPREAQTLSFALICGRLDVLTDE